MDSIIKNQNFYLGGKNGKGPEHWDCGYPGENLKPVFSWEKGSLTVSGNGNPYILGYWKQTVDIEENCDYRIRVRFFVEEIEDIHISVLNLICWLKAEKSSNDCPHDIVSTYHRENDCIIGEDVFKAPPGVKKAEIQLGLRFTRAGKVTWTEVALEKTQAGESRPVRITVLKWRPYESKEEKENLKRISGFLDQAGLLKSDLVLLPEFSGIYRKGLSFEEAAEIIPYGPICSLLREKAIQYGMNVCAGIMENDNGIIFNTAVIFDRKGELAGKYRKTHPYWPEEFYHCESPGSEYPVFVLDIGRVGVVICYDNWYGETYRLLALKGAELILFPNEAYEPLLMHARALDNRVYVAVSSLEMQAMIVNTKGRIVGETSDGILSCVVDMSDRSLPFLHGGGTLNLPAGGRRSARNTLDNGLYDELIREVKTWENRSESFHWDSRGKTNRFQV